MERVLLVVAMSSEAEALASVAEAGPARSVPGAEVREGRVGAMRVVIAEAAVGPIAAAVATGAVLAHDRDFDAVISAGIAGAFVSSGLGVGDAVVADVISQADLGKETDAGFETAATLGWRDGRITCDPTLVAAAAASTGAMVGELVTVTRLSTQPERIFELHTNFPGALGEAMEGAGVALAARSHGLEPLELRTISNLVGSPEEHPWDPESALDALAWALRGLGAAR